MPLLNNSLNLNTGISGSPPGGSLPIEIAPSGVFYTGTGSGGGGGITKFADYINSVNVNLNGNPGDGWLFDTSVVSDGSILTNTVTLINGGNTNATAFQLPTGIYMIHYQAVPNSYTSDISSAVYSSSTGASNSFAEVTGTLSSFTENDSGAVSMWTGLVNCRVNNYIAIGFASTTGAYTYQKLSIMLVQLTT